MIIDLPQGRLHCPRRGRDGPVLLFLHGFGQDHRVWEPMVDDLSVDHVCLTPDLPLGAHRLAMAPEADLTFRGLARVVGDLLGALDLTGVTLVGNDTGGAVAQVVAARHPDRLGRLVLTGCEAFDNFPPAQFRTLLAASRLGLVRPLMAALRVRPLRGLPSAFGLLTTGELPHSLIDDWLAAYRGDAGVRRDARKVLRAFGDDHLLLDVAAELSSFSRPTLVAWATDDRLFPFDHARRLAALLPHATLAPVPHSGTWVMRDQPAVTARLVRAFIRDNPLGDGAERGSPAQ